jgi:hypothetical protein
LLPNFLIIGAQKSGTSWLHAMLVQHPDVFMPDSELHFFDKEDRFERGVAWYEAHFPEAGRFRAVGEKTPDYLWANGRGVEGHLPDVHHNVHRVVPDAKLIVVLRDPVERAVSAVLHLLRTRRVSPLLSLDALLVGEARDLVRGHGVIEYGFYHRQIRAYLEQFDRERMLFLLFEDDIRQNAPATLRRVCEFLEIEPDFGFSDEHKGVNVARRSRLGMVADYYAPFLRRASRLADVFLPAYRPVPAESTIRELSALYEEENEKLFEMLGRRAASWTRGR